MSIGSFYTGDTPIHALLRDGTPVADPPYSDVKALWCGCIDAPDYLPAGSTVSGFEGLDTSRYTTRGLLSGARA